MSNTSQVSGQFTLTRVRMGDTLSFALNSSHEGCPWAQFVNNDNGTPTPDWTKEAKQPWLTPMASSPSGAKVTLGEHKWRYNGSVVSFDGGESMTDSGGGRWTKSVGSHAGMFAMNTDDGTIRPLVNLAGTGNMDDDRLEYEGNAVMNEHGTKVKASYAIRISDSGESPYTMDVQGKPGPFLSETVTQTVLTAVLMQGSVGNVSAEYVWTINGETLTDSNGAAQTGRSATVTRSMVNGIARVECAAKVGGTVVARASYMVTDQADEYNVELKPDGDGKAYALGDSDTDSSITLRARIRKAKDNSYVTGLTGVSWVFAAYARVNNAEVEITRSGDDGMTITTAAVDAAAPSAGSVEVDCMATATFTV